MNFIVAFQYKTKGRIFLVKVEQDDIFIAFPRKDEIKDEPIFLTKANGRWVGDTCDKKLVAKIGSQIDAVFQQKKHKRQLVA